MISDGTTTIVESLETVPVAVAVENSVSDSFNKNITGMSLCTSCAVDSYVMFMRAAATAACWREIFSFI